MGAGNLTSEEERHSTSCLVAIRRYCTRTIAPDRDKTTGRVALFLRGQIACAHYQSPIRPCITGKPIGAYKASSLSLHPVCSEAANDRLKQSPLPCLAVD